MKNNLQHTIGNYLKRNFKKRIGSDYAKSSFYYLDYLYFIAVNKVAIELFEVKKADKHEVLSVAKLMDVEDYCIEEKGDFYDKAAILLISLVKAHAFASGNRRTALLAVIDFANLNFHNIYIPDNPSNSKVLIGIREGYYEKSEIKRWLKNGKIRQFQR